MKYHCINYDEFNEISFKEGGLNGDCGFIGDNSSKNQLAICPSQANDTCGVISVNYNANNKCYEFYTFGENISGYTIASSTIQLIKNSPKDYVDFKIIKVKFSLLKIIRWVLFFLSLFFIISALIYGFKWEEFNKKWTFATKDIEVNSKKCGGNLVCCKLRFYFCII